MTVADLSERELVSRIHQRLAAPPAWLTVGIGDDAAVVETERNRLEVLTVDALVDGVHFDRRYTPPDAIGHRALAVNLSDLAAMGATPRLALLSLALPADMPTGDFDGMIDGFAAVARAHQVTVVGGNLTRTPGPLTVDVTALGTVKRRGVLTRAGARPGDIVYVTGAIGAAAAGLAMLRDGAQETAGTCVARYLRPAARVRVGQLLGRNRAPSTCVDLSDGLADGVARIADASGVGMTLEAAALPIEPEARAWFERHGVDPLHAALTGGDDYELLFTVRPRMRGRLKAAFAHGGVAITRIGVCTADLSRTMTLSDGSMSTLPAGYSHFR
ncbi:MAG: thiamine-phosphate kinase [Vicinamibacterales bacterium]